jgi:hypothetical protein
MKKVLLLSAITLVLFSCKDKEDNDKTEGVTTVSPGEKTPQQVEFADAKYTEMGKKMLAQFESGNLSEWMNGYADNAVYSWSSGDSLVGKPAIEKYWMDRRGKVIDSIKFTNDIWIPLKVNTPQRGPDQPGVWLLSWYQVNVRYKSGKSLMFWVHTDHHFNANDQIDRSIQYMDMAPVKEAIK